MDALLPWFTLKSVSGVGPHLFKRLLEHFASPAAVLAAPAAVLESVPGVSRNLARAIANQREAVDVRTEIQAAAAAGVRILTMDHLEYPSLLREIPDPPPWLYVKGQLLPCDLPIAMVGARTATNYGLTTAQGLAADLAASGATIVSGLALGIDAAAHQGALQAGGRTVAVLGSGLGCIYPPENRALAERIANSGALISELAMHSGPDAHHFPRRNRIISGMSRGTVVVEAGLRSGALITARLAAEQNREVFAVPGSIRSYKSAGTHHLIRQGAKLVAHARDILEEFAHWPAPSSAPPDKTAGLSIEAKTVLAALEVYPVHIDALARRLDLPAGTLAGYLLELEINGLAVQWPGKRFARQT